MIVVPGLNQIHQMVLKPDTVQGDHDNISNK